jgi:hypothetical protein
VFSILSANRASEGSNSDVKPKAPAICYDLSDGGNTRVNMQGVTVIPWSARSCSSRTTNGQCSARYMTHETIAPMRDDPVVSLPALAS